MSFLNPNSKMGVRVKAQIISKCLLQFKKNKIPEPAAPLQQVQQIPLALAILKLCGIILLDGRGYKA